MKSKFLNINDPLSVWTFWKDLKRSTFKYEWNAMKSDFSSCQTFFTMTRTDSGMYPKIHWVTSKPDLGAKIKPISTSYEKRKKCLYELYIAQTTSFRMISLLMNAIGSNLIKAENTDLPTELQNKQFVGACLYPFFPLHVNVCENQGMKREKITWPFHNMCYDTTKPCSSCTLWHRIAKEWLVEYSWMFWSGDNFIKPWDLSLQKYEILPVRKLNQEHLDFLNSIPESKQIVSVAKNKLVSKSSKKGKQEEEEAEEEESAEEDDDQDELIILDDGDEQEEEDAEEDEELIEIPKGVIPSDDAIVEIEVKPTLLDDENEEAEIYSEESNEAPDYDDD